MRLASSKNSCGYAPELLKADGFSEVIHSTSLHSSYSFWHGSIGRKKEKRCIRALGAYCLHDSEPVTVIHAYVAEHQIKLVLIQQKKSLPKPPSYLHLPSFSQEVGTERETKTGFVINDQEGRGQRRHHAWASSRVKVLP